jgi:carboxyl-terminal processing protease
MNPRTTKRIARVIAIITVAALVVTSATFLGSMYWGASYGASIDAEEQAYLNERLDLLKEYVKSVESQYKDDVDYKTLIDGAFAGVVDALGDPYSVYYADSGDSDDFTTDVLGVFYGVGLSLEEFAGDIRVIVALPGTPASKAGVMTGDVIKSVNGVSISGKSMNEVVAMIRGEHGTRVNIVFNREGADISKDLVRDVIRIASVEGGLIDDDIGYIRIASFDDDSGDEFRDMRDELIKEGAKSLIVDLRNNPGGLVSSVLRVADSLMPEGNAVYFRKKGKLIGLEKSSGRYYKEMPVVLLINKGSASGSEILAGALKDSGAATLVGTETYGKGVGQTIYEVQGGGSIKISTFYFETPDKHKVDSVGISPDYYVTAPAASPDETLERYMSFAPMSESRKPALGEKGLNVFGAQQRLALLGYDVNVTGDMDEATVEAVKRFQTSVGVHAYGVLDYGTMTSLDEECAKYAMGATTDEDIQLAKAIELLRGN